ncbi:MAG: SCO family protein [Bacteroidetes bacterium]|nr:SCO family protein [Bacteroidota bacterium]
MNKKALYALMLALLLPLLSYYFVKYFSDQAVVLPRHFLPDSTIDKTVSGKKVSDTFWHKLPDFSLTNQLGNKVSWNEIGRKIVVADFFFTHCPTICVPMTKNMKRLQESIKNSDKVGDRDPGFIQFLSFSIDPERDSVPQLKKYADRYQINPENWWLLTGDKKIIYDLALNDVKIALTDGNGNDSVFNHTDHFVLIDKNRNIRGYYHGLDSAALAKLSEDIIFLSLEKDRTKKSVFEGKLELIAIVILSTLALVGFLLILFKRRPNK